MNPASGALPKAMQTHTYDVMRRVEDTHWWFAGRRQLIASAIERAIALLPDRATRARILDVGCGTGANLELLARYGDADGVDVSPEALTYCRARGLTAVHEGAAEALPFADATFDLVTGLDVVEHLDDDRAGLREMHRVLRPGGCAVIFVPAFQFLWGIQDEISHHRRRYRLPELRSAMADAGLTVRWDSYANATFFAPILAGRTLMRWTGTRVESENNINVSALNGIFGRLLGAERHVLDRGRIPFGVSALCVAQRTS